jgi:SAM-dependent methyltransferase
VAKTTFDRVSYKETTREQWQDAAEAWHRWGPFLEDWLGAATEVMLDLADVREGARVLDVAAGAGGQTLAAARRAGEAGAVLATDISSNILDHAAAEARAAGFGNVATRVMDGEALDVGSGSFDAVISRLGLMYFPDKQRSLEEARKALKPGGRVAAIVFAEPDRNEFFSIPIGIIRRRAGLPAPGPGLPGPFSATELGAHFESAGFRDVELRRVEAPLRMASADDCVRLEQESFGALHQMLAGLEQAERDEAWREIAGELRRFEGAEGFVGPCELVVGAATR